MSYDMTDIEHKTFILGVERAGTTWLGNIFASSPAVDYYPEPFAPRTFVLEHFPGRLSYISESNDSIRGYLLDAFRGLPADKYRNGERFDSPPVVRKWVHLRKELNEEVSRRSGLGPSISLLRWQHLNLHRHDNPEVLEFRKNARPDRVIIKELRLNFQLAALADAFTGARAVVMMRNPYAQVDSMLRWMKRGSLEELRGVLACFFETIADHARFAFARDAIENLRGHGVDELLARCVAYWFINYTVLLEDLERMGIDWLAVRHEDVCEAPMDQTREIMRFSGLPFDPQTREYLASTTRATNEVESPRDTRRHSRSYYRQALADISPGRLADLKTACGFFWPSSHDRIRAYQGWLGENVVHPDPPPGSST
jgi:hypothetical protein